MPLVSTASIVDPAHRNGQGVAAFNVITLEHAEAIAAGAERAGQPAILQISENAVRFHRGRLGPIAAAASPSRASRLRPWPCTSTTSRTRPCSVRRPAPASARSCSTRRSSTTRRMWPRRAKRPQWAHEHEIWVEAELGEIGGKDGAHAPGVRTDPGDAREFVAATLVDGLAVAVGSSHAMVDRTAALDIALIHDLARRLAVPLVLHGSSGVPDAALAAAVACGHGQDQRGHDPQRGVHRAPCGNTWPPTRSVVDPRKYLSPARDAVCDEVARILSVISTARSSSSPSTGEPSPPPKERT